MLAADFVITHSNFVDYAVNMNSGEIDNGHLFHTNRFVSDAFGAADLVKSLYLPFALMSSSFLIILLKSESSPISYLIIKESRLRV